MPKCNYYTDKRISKIYAKPIKEGIMTKEDEYYFRSSMFIIPERDEGCDEYYPESIIAGYYTLDGIVELLRENCNEPDAVHFIADMLAKDV
jgi:hypothetical protein